MTLDYVSIVRDESARFAAVLANASPVAEVPSCPGWDTADLLWHLTEVQEFWGKIVADRLSDPEAMQRIDRPESYAELHRTFLEQSEKLARALENTDPAATVWTWAPDQSAGFVRRRQAHEALIHRVDAELAAGLQPTAVSAEVAADGIDEMVNLFIDVPEWGEFTPGGGAVALEPTDWPARWTVELGTFSGTSPHSGNSYTDLAAARPTEATADATITGTAGAIDFWLWGRSADVEISGDPGVADVLRALITESTQ